MTKDEPKTWDVCIYGATPAGIIAAVSAARLGRRVIILEPTAHFGGTITSGLNATDSVAQSLIRGIVREFFERCTARYSAEMTDETGFVWRPEARVAGEVLREMLEAANVTLRLETPILALGKDGSRLRHAELSDGERVQAQQFIDATYEGDLLPLAGVPFDVGREAAEEYGETWGGRGQWKRMLPWHSKPVNGLDSDGKPLPMLDAHDPSKRPGTADELTQSYCFRMTLTDNPDNRLPIPEPDTYDPAFYEIFRRLIAAGGGKGDAAINLYLGTKRSGYFNLAALPFDKYDMNSGPLAPTNSPYFTNGWITETTAGREKQRKAFENFTLGALHFIRNDPMVAGNIREFFSQFGLCQDEYTHTGGFPPALYVREGRRLRGDRVLNQNDIEDSYRDYDVMLGNAKYHLDCKPVRWSVSARGNAVREGMFFSSAAYQYHLPYWLILPQKGTVDNLTAVCAPSCSHVAFGSVRMEPTFMLLGAAAGSAASLGILKRQALHDIQPVDIRLEMRRLPQRLGRDREINYEVETGAFTNSGFSLAAASAELASNREALDLISESEDTRIDGRVNSCSVFSTHIDLTGWVSDIDRPDAMAQSLFVELEDGSVHRITERQFRPDVQAALQAPRAKFGFRVSLPLVRPKSLWVLHSKGKKEIPVPARKLTEFPSPATA